MWECVCVWERVAASSHNHKMFLIFAFAMYPIQYKAYASSLFPSAHNSLLNNDDQIWFFIRFVWGIMANKPLIQTHRIKKKKSTMTTTTAAEKMWRKKNRKHTKEQRRHYNVCHKQSVRRIKWKILKAKSMVKLRGTYLVWLAIKIRAAFTWHKSSIKRDIVFIVICVYTGTFAHEHMK